jgi:hypothetical protein
MKLLKCALASPIAAAMMAFSMPSSADTWILNTWGGDPSVNPGTGPWGQVDATNVAGGLDVDVTVTLYTPVPTVGFVNTGNGDHSAFTFSLSSPADVTIQNLTAGFQAGPNPATNPAFGTFTNGITCVVCGTGASNPYTGTLSFRIHDTGGITVGSFIQSTLPPGSMQSLFAADIFTSTGQTGTVGVTTAIPEPETYAMMLVGFGLLGFVARRRKQAFGNVVPA